MSDIFEAGNKLVRVTSLEITAPRPDLRQLISPEEEIEKENDMEKKERDEIIQMRRKFLDEKKRERKNKIKEDTLYKYNRDDMIEKVSKILYNHITFSEDCIPNPSQGASLFDEKIYKRKRWYVHNSQGFCSTLPIFVYSLEKVEYTEKM